MIFSPILSFPVGVGEFVLDTDASSHEVVAVLSQRQDNEENLSLILAECLAKRKKILQYAARTVSGSGRVNSFITIYM